MLIYKNNQKPIIFFRCDGGKVNGMGHVMQSVNLAKAFQSKTDYTIIFITYSPDKISKLKIEENGFQVLDSKGPAGSKADLDYINELGVKKKKEERPVLLVVDNRDVSSEFLSECKKCFYLICIDDEAKKSFPCHTLINYQLGFSEKDYSPQSNDRQLLLGPKYNLLRDEFFIHNRKRTNAKRSFHLLITMGGEDPYNHSSWFVKNLSSILQKTEVIVILGSAHSQKDQVISDIKDFLPNGKLIIDTNEMSKYMQWADLAITAGGTTCFELAAMGVPQVGIILEKFQKGLIINLEELGCLVSLGWHESLDKEKTNHTINELIHSTERLNRMSQVASNVYTESGTNHIVSEILKHEKKVR